MSYTQINAHVEDQTLFIDNMPKLASGGKDEVLICTEFDALWDGFDKTAVFYKKFGAVYHIPMDAENSVVVPYEVMKNKGVFYFGVFGENEAGTVKTTEVAAFDVVQGAAIENEVGYEPTPDIYAQIMAAANNAVSIAQSVRDDADAGLLGGGNGGDTVVLPETLPNPYAIVINGVSYDGSEKVEINIETEIPDSYTKDEIDVMFGTYITDIDALIGGDI